MSASVSRNRLGAHLGAQEDHQAVLNFPACLEHQILVIHHGRLEQGILDKTLFTMLVMMALVTTLMTTPLLYLMYRGTELEQPMEKSGFYHIAPGLGEQGAK